VKNFWLGFAAAIVILPVSVLAYVWLGLADMQANVAPPWWERRLMTTAVHISVARRAERTKPETAGPENEDQIVAGGKLYMNGCAGCHGELGKPFREDRSLYPPVPQLPHAGTQYTEQQIYWIVKHGIRMTAMSAYGPFYSEKELWSIAAFVHEIRNLPAGVQERILAKPKDSRATP
jgi:mono/diheme cytochrome c family protein